MSIPNPMSTSDADLAVTASESQAQQHSASTFPDAEHRAQSQTITDGGLSSPDLSHMTRASDQTEPEQFSIRTVSADEHRSYNEPILDDDLDDPNYFKKKRRQEKRDQNQAVRNMFAEFEDRYTTEHASQSQAEVFRPVELDSKITPLDHRVDAVISEGSESDEASHQRPRSGSIVPKLRIIPATPPPDPSQQTKQGDREYRPSPLSASSAQENSSLNDIDDATRDTRSDNHVVLDEDQDEDLTNQEASASEPPQYQNDDPVHDHYQALYVRSLDDPERAVGMEPSMSFAAQEKQHDNVIKLQDEFDEDVERHTPGGFVDDQETEITQSADIDKQSNPAQLQGDDAQDEVAVEPETVDWSSSKVRKARRRSKK